MGFLSKKKWTSESRVGVLLLLSCALALMAANSPLAPLYEGLVHYTVGIQGVSFSLQHLVNDGLMVLFFFVVGLEIKKELVVGELSSPQKASLPVFAALGGMLIPALIYLYFNPLPPASRGWSVPMATDIAFAIGILSLASRKVPLSLKVFLLALAIVDDVGAILVIAVFYSKKIHGLFLVLAAGVSLALFLAHRWKVKSAVFYVLSGVGLWLFMLGSGIHATVAGVILGLLTPASPSPSPASRLIKMLQPYVNNWIMPVFAFFNAGVALSMEQGMMGTWLGHPVSLGIVGGLVVGKPVGIVLFSLLAVKGGWAAWPKGFSPARLWGVGLLAGVGFTMSLFLSGLSFYSDKVLGDMSKMSVLTASAVAMILGLAVLLFFARDLESDAGTVGNEGQCSPKQ